MSVGRIATIVVVVVIVAVSAWWVLGGNRGPESGSLVAIWSGSYDGKMDLPAKISWCPATRIATLEAIEGETGMMATLFETDSVSAQVHPVVVPELRSSAPRPGAIAALRWVEDTTAIRAFQGISGLINLTSVGTAASGSFDLRMRSAAGQDSLLLRGSFKQIPITASATGCP